MATSGSTDRTLAEVEAEDLRRRLAALEADMASNRKERVSIEQLEEQYACNGPRDAGPPPPEGSFAWKAQERQRKASERAARTAERAQKAHDEKLAKNAKAIARVQAELSEVDEKAAAELERHRQAMTTIEKDRGPLKNKLDDLQSPPPVELEPDPDAPKMVPAYRGAGGRIQYGDATIVRAMRERGDKAEADVIRQLIAEGVLDASDYGLRVG